MLRMSRRQGTGYVSFLLPVGSSLVFVNSLLYSWNPSEWVVFRRTPQFPALLRIWATVVRIPVATRATYLLLRLSQLVL